MTKNGIKCPLIADAATKNNLHVSRGARIGLQVHYTISVCVYMERMRD